MEGASALVGQGVNRVVDASRLGEDLPEAVRALLAVRERMALRSTVKVLVDGDPRPEMWQTENLSSTGMLARTNRRLDAGTMLDLELNLPGDSFPLNGRGQVVRSTTGVRERVRGIGVRFTALKPDAQVRLEAFLSRIPNGR